MSVSDITGEARLDATLGTTATSVAWTQAGALLVGAEDGVYILRDGVVSGRLDGHRDRVRCVAAHPTLDLAAAGSDDATVSIWDVATAQLLARLTGHDAPVTSVSFHPTQDLVLTTSADRTLRLWTHSGESVAILRPGAGPLGPARFHPDGERIALATRESGVLWYDLAGKALGSIEHTAPVTALVFDPTGGLLVVGTVDGGARVYLARWDALLALAGDMNRASPEEIASDPH